MNYVRQIREITGEKEDREYDGLNGQIAQRLDEQICKKIFDIIQSKEEVADITDLRKFFAWLDIANRNSTKEIFTTNYDLLLEKAMEDNRIPYFDGFVGSYEPFFWPESIEKTVGNHDLTFNWIRLWKIHGSLNWEFRKDSLSDNFKIVRNGKVDVPENELVVYPSKEKYNLSRKQPFIAYFDRLKNYLLQGERVFIFSGYSFSDQHINEIICLLDHRRRFFMSLAFFGFVIEQNLIALVLEGNRLAMPVDNGFFIGNAHRTKLLDIVANLIAYLKIPTYIHSFANPFFLAYLNVKQDV